MFKKNHLILFLLVIICNTISAQREKIENLPSFDEDKLHFGFYLGLNKNDYKINYKRSDIENPNIEAVGDIGFNVGLIADLKLHKNINLRFEPGLISNTKTLYFNHISTGNPADSTRITTNTYLHVPVVLKFSTDRLNNIRPYVLAGISYDHNFSSNEKNENDNSSGEFRQKQSNLMYELGIGIDLYLPYFKLSPSIRGLFAINNEIKPDNPSAAGSPYTDPINHLGTSGIFLHLAFE